MKSLVAIFVCAMALLSHRTVGFPIKRTSPIFLENMFEEVGEYFEGDMMLSSEQTEAVKNGYATVIDKIYKWPSNIVYYTIDTTVYNSAHQTSIRSAMDKIEEVSCVRFVPRTTQKGFIFISEGEKGGCSARVGYTGVEQPVSLSTNGCMSRGTIIHELMHSLGFVHMQSSPDRDLYLDINYAAITPGKEHNFERYNSSQANDHGIPYDYDSVMHYASTAFSVNGQPTVIPKKKDVVIGQRNTLSPKDIKRLNHLYPYSITSQTMGTPVKRNSEMEMEMANELEEVGGNFEGDIDLTSDQEKAVKYGYTAIIGESFKWPNNIVPYTIDSTAFTLSQQNSIVSAIQQIELVSCVRFKPRTTEADYVKVLGGYSGCWASLGRRGGAQTVNLQPNGCMSRGTIIHEFLHALGFVHMQSASDRDFYVTINWAAIQADRVSNFDRYGPTVVDDFGIPYDYESVMHYGPTAFTYNGQNTIIPKTSGVTIGQRVGLSYKDIKRLNALNMARIVGGSDTTIANHPYQVSLRRMLKHSCGGAILNINTVLTAAHCVDYPELVPADFEIRAGSTFRNEGGQLSTVAEIHTHPSYNEWTLDWDISVLKLASPLVLGGSVQPIGLPDRGLAIPDGTITSLAGWGSLYYQGPSTNHLQHVTVPIVSNSRCGMAYQNFAPILPFHLCAGHKGRDACQGDSGGPLVYQERVVGIVSWGYGCAFENYPSVYTRVSEFLDFISPRL
uniref:Metalloendopeptidase n=1 Tax=Anopheles christyi TaxID=43041 RepID=A0A182JV62_9DIPT